MAEVEKASQKRALTPLPGAERKQWLVVRMLGGYRFAESTRSEFKRG